MGESVWCLGVCTPVWFERGSTSEPAEEVFVNYLLRVTSGEKPVRVLPSGFEITVPSDKASAVLDVRDGGSGFLNYKQFCTSQLLIDGRKTRRSLEIINCIEIKSLEDAWPISLPDSPAATSPSAR